MSKLKIAMALISINFFSAVAMAEDFPIVGPRFDEAQYVIKSITSVGTERTVILQRIGPYFSTFIKQKYNCSSLEYSHIAAAPSLERLPKKEMDPAWLRILPGDWCTEVMNYACSIDENKTAASGI